MMHTAAGRIGRFPSALSPGCTTVERNARLASAALPSTASLHPVKHRAVQVRLAALYRGPAATHASSVSDHFPRVKTGLVPVNP